MPSATVERTKVCGNPDCPSRGRPLPWSAFYAHGKWPDGTMRRPQAKCKRCSNAHRAQWARENKAKTQAARKRYWQHVRERMATDPEFAAEYREEKHFYNADYRRRCGKKPRPRRSSRSPRVLVDAGPFAEWLRARDGGDAVEIAKGVGTWAVTVRNIMDGKVSRVKISTVDAALTFAGEPHRLDELYPLNG